VNHGKHGIHGKEKTQKKEIKERQTPLSFNRNIGFEDLLFRVFRVFRGSFLLGILFSDRLGGFLIFKGILDR